MRFCGRRGAHDTSNQPRDIPGRQTTPPVERARIGFELFEVARRAVRAGILHDEPELSETEVRQKIFLRFYERDLTAKEIAWAMERIALRVADEEAGRA